MEFNTSDYTNKYKEFVFTHDGQGAPYPIAFGLARLSGGEPPTAASITVSLADEIETWRAMWLLPASVVYLVGSLPVGAKKVTEMGPTMGWVRKLSDLTAIKVVDQRAVKTSGVRLDVASALEFGSVTEVVPVNSGVETSYKASDRFVEAVRAAWLAS